MSVVATLERLEAGQVSALEMKKLYFIPKFEIHITPQHATLYPMNGAKHWKEEAGTRNTAFEGHKHHRFPNRMDLAHQQIVNTTARDIYMLVDGSRTGEELCRLLCENKGVRYEDYEPALFEFLALMVEAGHATLQADPEATSVRITGSLDYWYPPHISMEVTANCNIRCIHCYGTFEQKRFDQMDVNGLIAFLADAVGKGLRSIELTGGECTTHPNFPAILRYCCENLSMVAVLTNAVSLKEEVFETLAKYADKVVLQICINGNEEDHTVFTKVPIAYERAIRAVSRLAKSGVYVSTPMNLTFNNYKRLEETAQACLEAGSMQFKASFIDYSIGRAQELKTDGSAGALPSADEKQGQNHDGEHESCEHLVEGLTCKQQLEIRREVQLKLLEVQKRYPGYIRTDFAEDTKRMMAHDQGCGVAKRTVYIASNGKVGLCPMAVESGIPGFGDIGRQSLDQILDSELGRLFAALPAPNDHDCTAPDGTPCPHRPEHRGCILHGVRQYMKTPQTCWWGQMHNIKRVLELGDTDLRKRPDGSFHVADLKHTGTGCGCSGGSHHHALTQVTVNGSA